MNLLTTDDIAKRFTVARITAIKWCVRGLFPNARKYGRDWLVPDSDLLMFKKPRVGYPKGRERKPIP